jgi:predicted O-methyltransferase YrrM
MLRTAFAGDGIEKALVSALVPAFGVRTIVETGTFMGKTSYWLADTFPGVDVLTCELLPGYHEVARRNLQGKRNVMCVLDDSAEWLERLSLSLEGPALFFLDSHGMSSDWQHEHPVRREVAAVCARRQPSVILIDDFKVPGRPCQQPNNSPA